MPIRFRCGYCNKLLGIARRKAGTETTCPHCGYSITVPDEPNEEQTEMVDLDEFLNPPSAPESAPVPATRSPARSSGTAPIERAKAQTAFPATSNPPAFSGTSTPVLHASKAPHPKDSADREPNVDLVVLTEAMPPSEIAKSSTTAGRLDAVGGTAKSQIVLSVTKATAILVGVVLLLALSFAAGFLLASMK